MFQQANARWHLFILLTLVPKATHGYQDSSISTLQPCMRPPDFTNLVIFSNLTIDNLKNDDISPQNISELRIADSRLPSLHNGSFDSFIHLQVLILRNNHINFIASDAFRAISSLQVLDLGDNMLTDVAPDLLKPLQQLKVLHLDNNRLKSVEGLNYLPNLMYLDLSGNHVHNVLEKLPPMDNLITLKLQNAKISSVVNTTLDSMPKLCELDLSYNLLDTYNLYLVLININPEVIRVLLLGYQKNELFLQMSASTKPSYLDVPDSYSLPVMGKLTILDLSQTEIPLHQLQIANHWPNLVFLNLSSRSLDSVPDFIANTTVQELDLSSNFVQLVKTDKRFTNLKKLYLNRNQIKTLTDPDVFLAFPNLEELELNGNEMAYISSYAFQHLRHLQVLDLSKNILDEIVNYTFHGLESLTTLLLYHNNIKIYRNNRPFEKLFNLRTLIFHHNSLCELWTWVLPDLVSLEYLDFSENKIEYWNEHTFANNQKLKVLLLNGNEIRKFTDVMLEELSQTHFDLVTMNGNGFDCDDCSIENLQNWLMYKTSNCCVANCTQEETERCEPYKEITCVKKDGNAAKVDYNKVVPLDHCKKASVVVLACSISAVVLILVITTILIYRFRWYVKYYLYMWFGCLCFPHKQQPASYAYNAYISYSECDRLWLQNIFLPIMENKNTNLHFYVLERDFEPGRYIIENIMDGLENSSCFVALLSQEYLRNTWRLWEFNWAACRLVSQQTAECPSVLVFNLGNVKEHEMTSTMRSVLRTQMHFKWSAKGPRQKLIWEKLEQLFARHCVNNNNTENVNQNTVM